MEGFEAVEFATLEEVDWFNHRGLLGPIGNIPPAEAEEQYHARLEEPAMAAYFKRMASGKPGAVHGHFSLLARVASRQRVNNISDGKGESF